MENYPNNVPRQQNASDLLKEKIASVRDHREEQLKQYGKVLIDTEPKIVHTDMNGNILNERDQQELREKGAVAVK